MADNGASFGPGSREPSPAVLALTGFDPSRLAWHIPDNLRWLSEQGGRPDYMPCGMLTGAFLRTAANAFETAVAEGAMLRRREPIVARPYLHAYRPHQDYPWFCDVCGYAEHERLKHPPRDSDGSPKGGDGVAGSVHDSAGPKDIA